jgi:uncharacterized protein YndB with AHSA1/START domain
MSDLPEYILDRTFDAPRELVWRAWTPSELLSRWYGPGVDTIIHKFDLRPGGEWLIEMGRQLHAKQSCFQQDHAT